MWAMGADGHIDAQGRSWPADLAEVAAAIHPRWGCPVHIGQGWMGLVETFWTELRASAPGARMVAVERDRGAGLAIEVAWEGYGHQAWLARQARSRSYVTCEECGDPGRLRHDLPYVSILCDAHARDRDASGVVRSGTPWLLRRLLRSG